MFSSSKFEHDYKLSAFKYEEPISKDFKVLVNGEEIPVYTCRISRIPFNRPFPGYQRPIDQTEEASFVNIVSDEEIKIEVIINGEYEKVMIRPYAKNIAFEDNGGKVSFILKDEAQLVFATDDLHNPLYIFNSKPIECENPDSVAYYFGPGVHMPGKIVLKSNESVYLHKDALVFGAVYAKDAENIRVYGNGLFDDAWEGRFFIHCYEGFPCGNIKFYDCKNVSVEGVLFRNSSIWCVNLFHCFDSVLDNIKVFGQWRYNNDGVDIVNSKNITVKNSFIHSFDDAITIKGIDRYAETDNENILSENCVLWCDWGKTLEIGLETQCRRYRNIVFRNCDIIRAGNTVLDIQNGDCAEVSDIIFENINVEYNLCDKRPRIQQSEEQEYDAYDSIHVPALIKFGNPRFREAYANDTWKVPEKGAELDLTGVEEAGIKNIVVNNINIYYDERIPLKNIANEMPYYDIRENEKDGDRYAGIFIRSVVDGVRFRDISVSNITVNGERATKDDFIIDVSDTDNFTFDGEEL